MLIVARLAGLLVLAPVFSRKEIFSVVKMALVIWTAGLILFAIPLPAHFPNTPIVFILTFVCELCIGLVLGFVSSIFVIAIEFSGYLMDTQAGLSVAQILDPSTGRNNALLSTLLNWIALIIFVLIDGHHLVISALVKSLDRKSTRLNSSH